MSVICIIVTFFLISSFALLGELRFKGSYIKLLPISQILIIFWLFIGCALDLMNLFFYTLIFIIGAIYLYLVISVIRKKVKLINILNDIDLKIVLFTIFLLLIVCNYMKVIHFWDEFSFWSASTKVLSITDAPYICSNVHITANIYTPSLNLLYYFYEKVYFLFGGMQFLEWYQYVAYDFLLLSIVGALVSSFKCRVNRNACFLCAALLPVVLYSYTYDCLMVDSLVGTLVGAICINFYKRTKDICSNVEFIAYILLLAFIKDIYLYFALVIVIFKIFNTCIKNKSIKCIKENTVSILSILGIFILSGMWGRARNLYGTLGDNIANKSLKSINFKILIKSIFRMNSTDEYRQNVFWDFIKNVFESRLIIGNTGVKISYFMLLLILMLILYYVRKSLSNQSDLYCNIPIIEKINFVLPLFLFVLYSGILIVTYMFVFSKGEAEKLNCYDRYMLTFVLSLLIVIIINVFDYIETSETPIIKQIRISVILIVLMASNMVSIYSFLSRQDVIDAEPIAELEREVAIDIETYLDTNEKMFFLEMDPNGDYLGYAKMDYMLPFMQICTDWNHDLSFADESYRQDILSQFKYVLVKNNGEFENKYLYKNPQNLDIKDYELFESVNGDMVRLY